MVLKTGFATISKVFLLICSFFSLMLSANYYGAEGRGLIAGATGIVGVFAGLGGLSVGRVLVRCVALSKQSATDYFKDNFFSLLFVCFGLAFLTIAVAFILFRFWPDFFGNVSGEYLVMAFSIIFFNIWIGCSSYVCSLVNRMNMQSLISMCIILCYVVTAYVMVKIFFVSLKAFFLLSLFSTMLIGVVEILCLIFYLKPSYKVSVGFVTELLLSGLRLHMDTVTGVIFASAGLLVLNYYSDLASVGVYQVSLTLTSMMLIFPTVVSLHLNSIVATYGVDLGIVKSVRIIVPTMLLVFAGAYLASIIVPPVVGYFLPGEFDVSMLMFEYMAFGAAANSISILLVPLLIAQGRFLFVSVSTLILSVISISLCLLLVKKYLIWGAVYSYLWTNAFVFVFSLFFYTYTVSKARNSVEAIGLNNYQSTID